MLGWSRFCGGCAKFGLRDSLAAPEASLAYRSNEEWSRLSPLGTCEPLMGLAFPIPPRTRRQGHTGGYFVINSRWNEQKGLKCHQIGQQTEERLHRRSFWLSAVGDGFRSPVAAREQHAFARDCLRPDRPHDDVGIDLNTAVDEEAFENFAPGHGIAHTLGELRFPRDTQ